MTKDTSQKRPGTVSESEVTRSKIAAPARKLLHWWMPITKVKAKRGIHPARRPVFSDSRGGDMQAPQIL